MTPVDAMSTSSGRQPRRAATVSTTDAFAASPAGPLATLAFLDTTTTAWARPSPRLRRLVITLGPAKRLRVNSPAAGTGDAAASTTKSSVASFTPMLPTRAAKPDGSAVTTSGACRRAAGVELGADGREDASERHDVGPIEPVDHVAAHAGQVVGVRRVELGQPLGR